MNFGFTEDAMPPEVALKFFNTGAFFIFQDFPTGMEFGIDYKSWNVGEKFMGLKMIPPGVHFVYFSIKDMPRIGFFHNFQLREVVVRKWDKNNEDISDYVFSDEEIERVKMNLKNLDSSLGAYPYSTYQRWVSLSTNITNDTIMRLKPKNRFGKITSQTDLISKEQELEQRLGDPYGTSIVNRHNQERIRFTDASGMPIMTSKPGTLIKFTSIPQVGLADTNLKKAGIDSSDRFYKLLKELNNDYKQVLGEFQYAFVVFLMGQVYEGFEQWKRIIHLVCSCQQALVSHTSFFSELLMIFFFQVKECPDDFFCDTLAKDNFLASTLSLLFANLQDAPKDKCDASFISKGMKLKVLLEKKFNRTFDLPDD